MNSDTYNRIKQVVDKYSSISEQDREDVLQRAALIFAQQYDPNRGAERSFITRVVWSCVKMQKRVLAQRRECLIPDTTALKANNSYYPYPLQNNYFNYLDRKEKLIKLNKRLSKQQKHLLKLICSGKAIREIRKEYPGRKFYSSTEQIKLKARQILR
jgi:DNA-binding NarL/FixJ family response regulator